MASLSKSEFADYIWNYGILPLLSDTRIQNRNGAWQLSSSEVANASFTQTKGGWGASYSGGTICGPAGYQGGSSGDGQTGRRDHYPNSNGIGIRNVTDNFAQYWYTSNPYDGAPIGCTIYGASGPGSNGTYGNTGYTARLVVSTASYPAVDASTAYTAYIDYLTALGLFSTSYDLGSTRSYAFFLMGATAFWINSLLVIPWTSNYVFSPASSTGVTAFDVSKLVILDSNSTLSSSGVTDLFTGLVNSFKNRPAVRVTSASITGVPSTTTCSSSSSSSCSSSSSSSSCSSSSCSSSSCSSSSSSSTSSSSSSSSSSSFFIAFLNLGGGV